MADEFDEYEKILEGKVNGDAEPHVSASKPDDPEAAENVEKDRERDRSRRRDSEGKKEKRGRSRSRERRRDKEDRDFKDKRSSRSRSKDRRHRSATLIGSSTSSMNL